LFTLQVAVLGLPWEYTDADVCALLEAAAEADNAPPNDAGVERVEVVYRDDGKSEVGTDINLFVIERVSAHGRVHTALHHCAQGFPHLDWCILAHMLYYMAQVFCTWRKLESLCILSYHVVADSTFGSSLGHCTGAHAVCIPAYVLDLLSKQDDH
jgi:hypothetical protein